MHKKFIVRIKHAIQFSIQLDCFSAGYIVINIYGVFSDSGERQIIHWSVDPELESDRGKCSRALLYGYT